MKIGRQDRVKSAISTANAETIVVRGIDLCRHLIGRVTFTEHIWLLVTGHLPSEAQRLVLDSALVAIAEHGLVPSVVAGRMTLAAAPDALQAAVAAGLLGCGSVILGAAESAARLFADISSKAHTAGIEDAAQSAVIELREARRAVPGYGHPLHKAMDPRAVRLLEIAALNGIDDRHVKIAQAVERLIPTIFGKPLVMNVSAAIAAVLLDANYPLMAVKGIPILARTASLIAHLLEETERPIGFALAHSGSASIAYDGELPTGFPPEPE